MEKFAVLGVVSVDIAHSESAAATNGDSPDVDCGLFAGTLALTRVPVLTPRTDLVRSNSRVRHRVPHP
jgi:hypothetical protein